MVPQILGNPNSYNPLYNPSVHFIFHFLFHLILHYSRYPKSYSLATAAPEVMDSFAAAGEHGRNFSWSLPFLGVGLKVIEGGPPPFREWGFVGLGFS